MKGYRINKHLARLKRLQRKKIKLPLNRRFKNRIRILRNKYCKPTLWSALLIKSHFFRQRYRVSCARIYKSAKAPHALSNYARKPTVLCASKLRWVAWGNNSTAPNLRALNNIEYSQIL